MGRFWVTPDRVIYMILKLNNRYNIQFIHGYAPTSQAEVEEMKTFIKDLSKAMTLHKTHYKTIRILVWEWEIKKGIC